MSSESMPYGVNFVSEFNNHGDMLDQSINLVRVVLNSLEHSDRTAEFQTLLLAHQHLRRLAELMRPAEYVWQPSAN